MSIFVTTEKMLLTQRMAITPILMLNRALIKELEKMREGHTICLWIPPFVV